jgi:hypothetical protein
LRAPRSERFRVYTTRGTASYRSRSHAITAARWVSRESGDSVTVVNERTGQRWDVPALGGYRSPPGGSATGRGSMRPSIWSESEAEVFFDDTPGRSVRFFSSEADPSHQGTHREDA